MSVHKWLQSSITSCIMTSYLQVACVEDSAPCGVGWSRMAFTNETKDDKNLYYKTSTTQISPFLPNITVFVVLASFLSECVFNENILRLVWQNSYFFNYCCVISQIISVKEWKHSYILHFIRSAISSSLWWHVYYWWLLLQHKVIHMWHPSWFSLSCFLIIFSTVFCYSNSQFAFWFFDFI